MIRCTKDVSLANKLITVVFADYPKSDVLDIGANLGGYLNEILKSSNLSEYELIVKKELPSLVVVSLAGSKNL